VVALPGGCGTWEELLEAMAWKRLGLWHGAIVIVNQGGFYDPLLQLLDRAISQRFMDPRQGALWSLAAAPEEVVEALRSAPTWTEDARSFAVP
jgi:predicted Rossmann-fold nucleotide-binding protein